MTQAAPPKKTLSRELKPFSVLLITLSLITPGCSFFILTPGVIKIAGSGALLSFLLASAVAMLLAFVWAELSSAFPMSGGDYTLVGKTLGRFLGFIMLVLVMIITCSFNALTALSVATYLNVIFGKLNPIVVALITTFLATSISIVRISVNAVITGIFLGVELLLLGLITVVGFSSPDHPFSDLLFNTQTLEPVTHALTPVTIGILAGAMSVALFTLNGYGAAVYFGEETIGAQTSMSKIILYAVVLSVLTQAFPLVAMLTGTQDLVNLFSTEHMVEYFLMQHVSFGLIVVASLCIVAALFNAMIASILTGARLMFSSGRDGLWSKSINHSLSSLNDRFDSPAVSTIVVGVISAGCCFFTMDFLILATSSILVATYFLICLAVIAGRLHGKTKHGHYRMPLYPLPPLIAILTLIYVVYSTWMDKEFGRPSLIATGIILAASVVYYLLFLSWRKDWSIKGPDEYL